jgi:hypothetical protein
LNQNQQKLFFLQNCFAGKENKRSARGIKKSFSYQTSLNVYRNLIKINKKSESLRPAFNFQFKSPFSFGEGI